MFLQHTPQLEELLRARQSDNGGNPGGSTGSNGPNGSNGSNGSNGLNTNNDVNNAGHGSSTRNYTAAIVVASVAVVFTFAIFAWIGFRRWQRTRKPKYSRSGRDDNDHSETPATTETRPLESTTNATGQVSSTVDRQQSVRSVMTLPPYRPRPLENEAVLGREGERDGIDVVIEMPTAEADEALREEEMDALYQIRLARRRHMQEQEARRLARQEARARGDRTALQTIREQSRTATTNNPQEIERLRNEHARAHELRQRAISSVNYADLGVARHDGTRIRANSSESERIGLLSDAASIGASARSQSALSQNSPRLDTHQRGRSGSSVISVGTTHSDELVQEQQPLSGSGESRTSSLGRAGSSPELIDPAEADMGEGGFPLHAPPGYDEVSLNDLSPQPSPLESPYAEPPPDYDYTAASGSTPGSASGPASGSASGPGETRNQRVSAHFADLATEVSLADGSTSAPAAASESATSVAGELTPVASDSGHSSSSGSSQDQRQTSQEGGVPRLPSLRVAGLPQIVIEPSSAVPRDRDE